MNHHAQLGVDLQARTAAGTPYLDLTVKFLVHVVKLEYGITLTEYNKVINESDIESSAGPAAPACSNKFAGRPFRPFV